MYILNMLLIYTMLAGIENGKSNILVVFTITVAIIQSWLVLSEFGLAVIYKKVDKMLTAFRQLFTNLELTLLVCLMVLNLIIGLTQKV